MSDLCSVSLQIVGMDCAHCGRYVKAYLEPTEVQHLNERKPIKHVADFICPNCGYTWYLKKTETK